ncbi:helix-turn-helix domain-containing protein [Paraconexibacter algicola]|uniref:Helix-turn-helix domain-containing protein n=1 Tax=Paraconexibacter algicola TaxID=2133960 RepID=A0A2T4UM86_9ACTN|nr:hypothetical protein C7Y72_12105 [Paraconexibacter algicola]
MLRPRLRPHPHETQGEVVGDSRDWVGMTPLNSQRHLPSPDDALLDAAEAAKLLHVPTSWVYAEARAGRLPHVRVGRYRRFRRGTLEEWIASQERGPRR